MDVFGGELSWQDKHPLRLYAMLSAAVLLANAGLTWSRNNKEVDKPSASDSSIGTIIASCLVLALLGTALMLMPHLYGIWGQDDFGIAAVFVGLFLCLSGAVSALAFLGPSNTSRVFCREKNACFNGIIPLHNGRTLSVCSTMKSAGICCRNWPLLAFFFWPQPWWCPGCPMHWHG